jgi:hypothetical protein
MSSDLPVPPYDDRKQVADPVEDTGTEKDGADVGGARRHRTSDPGTVDDHGGRTTSSAEEQPAVDVEGGGQEDPGVGPAHVTGVRRGEDRRG